MTAPDEHALAELVRTRIEPLLLGGPRRYTHEQLAAETAAPTERAARLWLALGFPAAPDTDAVRYTQADAEALRTIEGLVADGVVDTDMQVAVTRTVGQAMARLAEWQFDVLSADIAVTLAAGASPTEVRERTQDAIDALERLQSYAWRRHLHAAAGRALAVDSDPSGRTLAIGFADMVGYTRLTRHLDMAELTRLLENFESTSAAAIASHGGWVIKNVGDEVMFAAEHPADAARIASDLHAAVEQLDSSPALRVGLAYGTVLQRFGDLYGTVVNVAARLTGVARPGTTLADDGMADSLDSNPDFTLRHLRPVRVRGINRLRAHVVRASVRI